MPPDERLMRALAPYALIGMVLGFGLGLNSNVSGAVLAFYGLIAGAGFAAGARVIADRRRAGGPSTTRGHLGWVELAGVVVAAFAIGVFMRAQGGSTALGVEDPVAQEARPTQLSKPDPSDYRPATARRAAAEFLDAWHDRDWDRMATRSALLWRENVPDPAASLRLRFGRLRLTGAYQRELRRSSANRAVLVVELPTTEGAAEIERRISTMDLRREGGRWPVEPISVEPARAQDEGE